jgi:DASH complex subunit DAM1
MPKQGNDKCCGVDGNYAICTSCLTKSLLDVVNTQRVPDDPARELNCKPQSIVSLFPISTTAQPAAPSRSTNMDPAPAPRSNSRSRLPQRSPISRPTTPLRPSSRSSLRNSQNNAYHGSQNGSFPLDALEAQFAELTDSMADLEANFMHLQLMHESLSRFGESFASFLYGLNMRAFCVDFPEVR